jgi:hypothetical protein
MGRDSDARISRPPRSTAPAALRARSGKGGRSAAGARATPPARPPTPEDEQKDAQGAPISAPEASASSACNTFQSWTIDTVHKTKTGVDLLERHSLKFGG